MKPLEERTCEICGATFQTKYGKKVCSDRCWYRKYYQRLGRKYYLNAREKRK